MGGNNEAVENREQGGKIRKANQYEAGKTVQGLFTGTTPPHAQDP